MSIVTKKELTIRWEMGFLAGYNGEKLCRIALKRARARIFSNLTYESLSLKFGVTANRLRQHVEKYKRIRRSAGYVDTPTNLIVVKNYAESIANL